MSLHKLSVLVLLSCTVACTVAGAQRPRADRTPASLESFAAGRLVIVYRGGFVPADADGLAAAAGTRVVHHMARLGMSAVAVDGDMDAAMDRLRSRPEVAMVLRDRTVRATTVQAYPLRLQPTHIAVPQPGVAVLGGGAFSVRRPVAPIAVPRTAPETVAPFDTYYDSPQGWATQVAGGYGADVPGGAATGPWNTTLGRGVRIAILDSGVDSNHPDIAPNLALNLSEIDQETMPSACDDGSAQDQAGHGTFTASLATGALGMGTGLVVGVAPQATLLNIKVVQRMPGTGATTLAQCEAGEANGLLSWVLQGIEDAIANHASVISLSLGTLVDVATGDGAGWQSQMDSVAYAASQAGAVLVAAAGNDGLDLATGSYVELPAQARGVLAVVASTNPACAENQTAGAVCAPGPVTRASYSNFGEGANELAAPGGSEPQGGDMAVSGFVRGACSSGIPGTTDGLPGVEGQSLGCFNLGHTAYVQAIGTSAAAPLVAGAVALLQAAHPEWTPAQTVSALLSSGKVSGSLAEPELDLPAALSLP